MVLYINACVRDESRTDRLARVLLDKIGNYTELKLSEEGLKPLDKESLEYRSELIAKGQFDNDIFKYARQFADADVIVISAPFWDMSFPAILKTYIENIYITGLVSKYGEDGRPVGLCKASKLYYVTTAGGPYEGTYSYDYIKDLALGAFGIKDTELIFAEMLDIAGNDPEKILDEVIDVIKMKQV